MIRFSLAVLLCLGLTSPVMAGSHLWVINEVFSNADGTIQFVEMKECCGAPNEIFLVGKWVSSDTTGMMYDFTENLPPNSTADKFLLLATVGFTLLPGAPTPDYIIPDNFFSIDADVIRYWTYPNAPLEFALGELPTDGILSLNQDGTTAINSPTNFADETGSVILVSDFVRGDVDTNGVINALVDAMFLLNFAFTGGAAPACADSADADDDGVVNGLVDGTYILGYGFLGGPPPAPPFPDCGPDPTPDSVPCGDHPGCP